MLILDRHPKSLGKESGHGDQGYTATADQLSAFNGTAAIERCAEIGRYIGARRETALFGQPPD